MHLTFARSVDPIEILDIGIGRVVVTSSREEAERAEKNSTAGTMGRKFIVPYGPYVAKLMYNPYDAEKVGFTQDDLKALFKALPYIYELTRSASKGLMTVRKVIAFQHSSMLGEAQAASLFDRVRIERIDPTTPPRKYTDYRIEIDREGLPPGIEIIEIG